MDIQVVTMPVQELLGIIKSERENAYAAGYVKAKAEIEQVKIEPKFKELLRGVKELREYLIYKGYWSGSISTLSKIAPQLLDEREKQGQRLIFRCGCIDHAFANGFRFKSPSKKPKKVASL